MEQISVHILAFNEVEVLDLSGPYEVFSITENENKEKLFKVSIVAEKKELLHARNRFPVFPHLTLEEAGVPDILIIPGGYGAEEIEIHNKKLLNWIKEMEPKVKILASICTGAFLLAEAGILDDMEVTTHWMDQETLRKNYPKIKSVVHEKFIDHGHILTSGGVSRGILMSLHLVEKLVGRKIAEFTARRMEFDSYS
ncbi:DJ-1/PfpI family protein [Leptospira saintgironsiae]|uniref:AraC family transcriptional regulator n=1 Tax=Leptospira saintgironsiae TaxID=2023183 RepID=A0A2M9YEU8_9LEPT|nr:DJ-1/PfpI family protein [Leptospira saintgironsiae]PJZ50029.1 AraC family transcriptional regulator [Leptospira saintgironsiae]